MAAIIGSRWTCHSVGGRTFDCPFCSDRQEGEERTLTRWLTLLDRSVMSLGEAGRFYACGTCGRAYRAHAIGRREDSGTRVLSEDERAILSVVSAVIFSDSSVRAIEKRAARSVIRRYTGRDLDAAGVKQLLRTSRERWRDPVERLRRLAPLLDERAKRRILAAAYLISGSDRELHPEEGRLLMRIGEALGVNPRDVRAAMKEAREEWTR